MPFETKNCRNVGRSAKVLVDSIVDLVFPRLCFNCDREIPAENPLLICLRCQNDVGRQHNKTCETCGAGQAHDEMHDGRCGKCRGEKFAFSSAISLGEYQDKLREIVIEMKHSGQEALTIQVGRWLGGKYRERLSSSAYDLCCGMPTHWTRHFSRGTNVAALLCEGLSRETGIHFCQDLLRQTRPTRKQGTLSRRQRLANVRNSFSLSPGYSIEDLKILLVDDVMTSGATVNEAAKLLRNNGAVDIGVAVVARGVGSF